ncbi:hypothetical protein T484DRAFT_1779905, partial [Baffinella frigidus]
MKKRSDSVKAGAAKATRLEEHNAELQDTLKQLRAEAAEHFSNQSDLEFEVTNLKTELSDAAASSASALDKETLRAAELEAQMEDTGAKQGEKLAEAEKKLASSEKLAAEFENVSTQVTNELDALYKTQATEQAEAKNVAAALEENKAK